MDPLSVPVVAQLLTKPREMFTLENKTQMLLVYQNEVNRYEPHKIIYTYDGKLILG